MVDWQPLRAQLPVQKGRTSDRKALWEKLCEQAAEAGTPPEDPRELTLSQLEAGLEQAFECEELLNLRAAIQRACAVARTVNAEGPEGKMELQEFRLLLVYLEGLMQVFEVFPTLDASEECEVSYDELKAAWPGLSAALPRILGEEGPYDQDFMDDRLEEVYEELRGDSEGIELYKLADWAICQDFNSAGLLEDPDQDNSSAAAAAAAEFRSSARVVIEHHPKLWDRSQPPDAVLECLKADTVDQELLAKILMQKNPDINMRERNFHWTPLLFAANTGTLRVLTLLLQKRADVKSQCIHGNSAMHLAARRGHVQCVKYMIGKAKQMKLNLQNQNGHTSLACCAMMGHSQVAELLVKAEADLGVTDAEGMTAGMWAARNGHADVMNVLLAEGFDLNVQDQEERTVLDFAVEHIEMTTALLATQALNCSLLDAVQRNCAAEVKAALDSGAYVDSQDSAGWSPLSWAMLHHSMDMVLLLAQRNANPNVCKESLSQLDLGADKEALESSLVSGLEAGQRLIAAAKANDWERVDYELSQGANVNYREQGSLLTCLMCAAIHSNLEALLDFTGTGKNASLRECDIAGWTVVHFAAFSGSLDIVSQLYFMKADFFAKTYEKQQLLHIAARADDGVMIQLIVAAKGKVNAKDAENCTPLQIAVRWGSPEAVSTLIALEADPNLKMLEGRSLLAEAVVQGHTSVIEALLEELPALPTIIDEDFWQTRKKGDKQWQLYKLAHKKNLESQESGLPEVSLTHMLVDKDKLGRGPLCLAVIHHTHHLLPLLLDKKAQIDDVDKKGNSALIWAAAGGDRSVVEFLLQAGAQSKLQNKNGQTAADVAKTTGLRRLLQKHMIEGTLRIAEPSSALPATGRTAVRILHRLRLEGLPMLMMPDAVEEELNDLLITKKAPRPYYTELVVDPVLYRPLGYAYLDFLEESDFIFMAQQKDWQLGQRKLRFVKEGPRSEIYQSPLEDVGPTMITASSSSDSES